MLDAEAAQSGKVLVLGHRGAMGHAPENTMVSFQMGYDLGADLLELDVHLSKDEELVVIHDAKVDRTTNSHGYIKDMSLEEIKSIDAGIRFDLKYKGQQIPTLKKVLDWAKDRIQLVIEIKGDPHPAEGIEEKLVQLLRKGDMSKHVMVISFHHPSVRRAKELEPSLTTGILYTGHLVDTVGAAKAALVNSVRPNWEYWSVELVEEVHKAGMSASTWNANDEKVMEYCVNLGIDSIGSNYPDRLRAYLDRNGISW